MKLQPTSLFRRQARRLTRGQQDRVQRALERLQADPSDPRLRLHKLSGRHAGRWAISAGYDLRVVCLIQGDTATLLAVGTHDDVYRD